MLENWRNWCRLCGKSDSTEGCVIHKMESIDKQLEIVNKHFMIALLPLDGSLSSMCSDCCIFVTKLETFSELCLKTEQMFRELISSQSSETDLQAIRCKHGIDDEEIKYSFSITDTQQDALKQDPQDPLVEFRSENTSNIKEEVNEAPKKQRGRPRKVNATPKVKKELKEIESDTDCRDDTPLSEHDEDEMSLKSRILRDTSPPPRKRKRIWKGPREKKHSCTVCSMKFNRPHLLREHTIEEHQQEDMTHECTTCSKRFSCKRKLTLHEISHLPGKEGLIHPCPHCDKKFNHKYKIPSHIRAMHTGDKPFVCEECGNSFKTKGALNAHQISHNEERPYQCTTCLKKFKTQRALKKHDKDTHKESLHDCPHCEIKLKSTRTLKMHLLVHSDVKNFKCNYCGSEFKRRKTLKDHLILHTGQRPYECPFCDKTFANGSNLISHKKKSHPMQLAAQEASGEQPRIVTLPKIEQLQPKEVFSAEQNCETAEKD